MSWYPDTGPQQSGQPSGPLGPPAEQHAQGRQPTGQAPTEPPARLPEIDILDNTNELWVFVNLPGFKPEEIQIKGDETTLLLSGERFAELEEGRTAVLQERPVRVERQIQLPTPVDVNEADALFEDGVCTITLPKATAEQYHRIEIRSE